MRTVNMLFKTVMDSSMRAFQRNGYRYPNAKVDYSKIGNEDNKKIG